MIGEDFEGWRLDPVLFASQVKIVSLRILVLAAYGITSLIRITLQVQCLWPSMRPLAQACMRVN